MLECAEKRTDLRLRRYVLVGLCGIPELSVLQRVAFQKAVLARPLAEHLRRKLVMVPGGFPAAEFGPLDQAFIEMPVNELVEADTFCGGPRGDARTLDAVEADGLGGADCLEVDEEGAERPFPPVAEGFRGHLSPCYFLDDSILERNVHKSKELSAPLRMDREGLEPSAR